jgi:hypothetical protein
LDSSDSGEEAVAGCCEHGDEPSHFIKGGELLVAELTPVSKLVNSVTRFITPSGKFVIKLFFIRYSHQQ